MATNTLAAKSGNSKSTRGDLIAAASKDPVQRSNGVLHLTLDAAKKRTRRTIDSTAPKSSVIEALSAQRAVLWRDFKEFANDTNNTESSIDMRLEEVCDDDFVIIDALTIQQPRTRRECEILKEVAEFHEDFAEHHDFEVREHHKAKAERIRRNVQTFFDRGLSVPPTPGSQPPASS